MNLLPQCDCSIHTVINIQSRIAAMLLNGFNCAENFIAFNESTEEFRPGSEPFKPHLH